MPVRPISDIEAPFTDVANVSYLEGWRAAMAAIGTIKIKVELEWEPDGTLPIIAYKGDLRAEIGRIQITKEQREALQAEFDRATEPLAWTWWRDISLELDRQDAKWGEQNHPDGTGAPEQLVTADLARAACDAAAENGVVTWQDILLEEVMEALAEQWVEAIERRKGSRLSDG